MKLFKKLVVFNVGKEDEKSFYTFYIKLDNGESIKVQPNSYTDKSGKVHSNYDILCVIAQTELPFDK